MGQDDETETVVLDYLTQQNRPYNLSDIFQNLHQKHGKAALQKALTKLTEAGKVVEKENGKQKIYYINQADAGSANQSELDELDAKMNALKEKVQLLNKECDTLSAMFLRKGTLALKGIESSMSKEEITAEIKRLVQKNAIDSEKLERLSKCEVQVSSEDRAAAEKAYSDNLKHFRKRKRWAKDILDSIMENYPKKMKQLLEETGVETDEDAKVDFSAWK